MGRKIEGLEKDDHQCRKGQSDYSSFVHGVFGTLRLSLLHYRVFVSARLAALPHLVNAARVERVTLEQSRQTHPYSSSRAVLVDGLPCVLRATWMKPAGRRENGGDEELVALDEKQDYCLHVSTDGPGNHLTARVARENPRSAPPMPSTARTSSKGLRPRPEARPTPHSSLPPAPQTPGALPPASRS